MSTLTQIWDKTYEAIFNNTERQLIDEYKSEYLKVRDVRFQSHYKNAWQIMEVFSMVRSGIPFEKAKEIVIGKEKDEGGA